MRKSILSLLVMLVAAAALISNLVYAYVLIPGSGVYVSLPGSEGELNVVTISGVKFYDANANGVRDYSEVGIKGWKIQLYKDVDNSWMLLCEVETDNEGRYTLSVGEGTYRVVEVMPPGATVLEAWVQTAPLGGYYEIEINAELGTTYDGNDFGNVYLKLATGGRTIGFWGNRNGQDLISPEDIGELNELSLYKPTGWAYPPFTDKAEIKNYLRNATAEDISWMLSAQLIATKLNVLHGFLSNSTIVYVESSGTFITIGEVMKNAYAALQGTGRDVQEYWKNLLDGLNNNWLPSVCSEPVCP